MDRRKWRKKAGWKRKGGKGRGKEKSEGGKKEGRDGLEERALSRQNR